MMNERKLNINAPLMSVRRSSASSPSLTEAKRKILENQLAIPYFKSEMTLDQVTEPVTVPFNREHIPGRPKGNDGSESQPPKEASIVPSPSFPPGKSINVGKQALENEPKFENKFRSSNKSNSLSDSVSKVHYDKEPKNEKIKSVEEDDDDDVYSDAVETLSPTESFSMNCSLSGVSGLDNLDASKSKNCSTDKQAQDFMMNRFLPAAKAMTLQPPQYASRKQSVLVEQPRDFRKLVREEKKSFVKRHITDIVPYVSQFQEEEEAKESDNETDDYPNISAKGCGMFPSLCIRNSLCLLNPVPGTKMGNQFPLYSAYEVGKPNKSYHIHSHGPAPAIKKAWDVVTHKSKSSSRVASPDMHEVRKTWTSESSRFSRSATGIYPFRSKPPQSPFPGAKLLGDSKQAENNKYGKLKFPNRGHASFKEVLSQAAKKCSNSGNLTIEKTLDIDTEGKATLSSPHLSSVSNTKKVDIMAGKERNSIVDSFQNMSHQEALEETLDSEVSSSVDAHSLTLSSMLSLMAKEDKAERLASDQDSNQESMSLQLVPSSFDKDTKINNNRQIVLVDDSGKAGTTCVVHHPLAPPLPKSPSESWLCRALPLVSLKNSFPRSNQGTQFQAKRHGLNRSSSYTKWETIVKTSNLHHDRVRCSSQELAIYKPQHSKS